MDPLRRRMEVGENDGRKETRLLQGAILRMVERFGIDEVIIEASCGPLDLPPRRECPGVWLGGFNL